MSNSKSSYNNDELLYWKAFENPVEYSDTIDIRSSIWRTALAHAHILNKDVDDTLLKDICGHFLNLPQASLENGISYTQLCAYKKDPNSLFAKVKNYRTETERESDGTDASEDSDGTDDSNDTAGTHDSKDNAGTDDSPAAKEEAIPPLSK